MQFSMGVKSSSETAAWLQQRISGYELQPSLGLFAVVLKSTNEVIGYCGFSEFKDIEGRPEIEIGYRFLQQHWGKGYATEAALFVQQYGFEQLNISRLVSLIDPGNLASIRVAQKTGMTFEKEVMMEGYTHPDHLYVIQKEVGG